MAEGQLQNVIDYLRRIIRPIGQDESTDRNLLESFVSHRDEAAFAELVRRHGPMIRGVCRRVLNDTDVEDAFQATFLVLARKAGSAAWRESVGNWLYGTAYRTAMKARTSAARRQAHEKESASMQQVANRAAEIYSEPSNEVAWNEIRTVLDETLNGLPAKYRTPIVLCYLEGKSNEEAAKLLGCSKGTVSGRLARARDLLRDRLTRRGIGVSSAALTTVLSHNAAEAAVPTVLADSTAKAAVLFSTGETAIAGVISIAAGELAKGVMKSMFLTKMKIAAVVFLGLAVSGTGAGILAYDFKTAEPEETIGNQAFAEKGEEAKTAEPAPPSKSESGGPTPVTPLNLPATSLLELCILANETDDEKAIKAAWKVFDAAERAAPKIKAEIQKLENAVKNTSGNLNNFVEDVKLLKESLTTAARAEIKAELQNLAKEGKTPTPPKPEKGDAFETARGSFTYQWTKVDTIHTFPDIKTPDLHDPLDPTPRQFWNAAAEARANMEPIRFLEGCLLFSWERVASDKEKFIEFFILTRHPGKAITEKHLLEIKAVKDEKKKPQFSLRLNGKGAAILFELTSSNQPEQQVIPLDLGGLSFERRARVPFDPFNSPAKLEPKAPETPPKSATEEPYRFRRYMGVMVDGKMITVSPITNVLRTDVTFTGNFSEDEVEAIVATVKEKAEKAKTKP